VQEIEELRRVANSRCLARQLHNRGGRAADAATGSKRKGWMVGSGSVVASLNLGGLHAAREPGAPASGAETTLQAKVGTEFEKALAQVGAAPIKPSAGSGKNAVRLTGAQSACAATPRAPSGDLNVQQSGSIDAVAPPARNSSPVSSPGMPIVLATVVQSISQIAAPKTILGTGKTPAKQSIGNQPPAPGAPATEPIVTPETPTLAPVLAPLAATPPRQPAATALEAAEQTVAPGKIASAGNDRDTGTPGPIGGAAAFIAPSAPFSVTQTVGVTTAAAAPLAHALSPTAAAAPHSLPSQPTHQTASPAAQLSGAVIKFAAGSDRQQRLSVQLAPEELGKVQISLARNADGGTAISVTAERSETLALLVDDQSSLQRALDQAGVPVAGRSLSFSLAEQDLGAGAGQPERNADRSGGSQQAWGSSDEPDDAAASSVIPISASRVGLVNITA